MRFEHCSNKFKPYDIWYLYDNKGFYERCLYLGRCPICKKDIAELRERRKSDDKLFKQLVIGKDKVKHLADLNKNSINYSASDIRIKNSVKISMPRTIRYGENKLIKRGDKTILRQNAVSWIDGRKENIKDINL